MLEFKNTSVNLANGKKSNPFSLVVDKGEVVCLCGCQGSGKSAILRAILGLEPISNGFITVDGELVTPGAASYFRRMTAYIPQQLPHNNIKVSELIQKVFSLHSNLTPRLDMESLLALWKVVGLDKSLLDRTLDKVDDLTLQEIMLSFVPALNKEIILLDNIFQSETTQNIISRLVATSKAEVVYTCRENKMDCNKLVNL